MLASTNLQGAHSCLFHRKFLEWHTLLTMFSIQPFCLFFFLQEPIPRWQPQHSISGVPHDSKPGLELFSIDSMGSSSQSLVKTIFFTVFYLNERGRSRNRRVSIGHLSPKSSFSQTWGVRTLATNLQSDYDHVFASSY